MATEFVALGGDLVKEDETYSPPLSQLVSNVSAIQNSLDELQSARRGVGLYVPNITGLIASSASIGRLRKAGLRGGMIAFFAAGLDAVRQFAESIGGDGFLWGHRVGYECMRGSLSVTAMVQLAFAAGLDAVHVGTPILSKRSDVEETGRAVEMLRLLAQREGEVVLPIFSKTSRSILPGLLDRYGRQTIMIGCGEFHKRGSAALDRRRIGSWIDEVKGRGKACGNP